MINSTTSKRPSSSEIIAELKDHGFTHTFKFKNDTLVCVETSAAYPCNEIDLEAIYRFEGVSDPDDLSILYVFRAHDGTGGTIFDGYGPKSTPGLGDFFTGATDLRDKSEIMKAVPASHTLTISGGTIERS